MITYPLIVIFFTRYKENYSPSVSGLFPESTSLNRKCLNLLSSWLFLLENFQTWCTANVEEMLVGNSGSCSHAFGEYLIGRLQQWIMILITLVSRLAILYRACIFLSTKHFWGRGGGCHIVSFYLQHISACDHSCLGLEAKQNHIQLVLHNCFSARMSLRDTRGVGLTFNWKKKKRTKAMVNIFLLLIKLDEISRSWGSLGCCCTFFYKAKKLQDELGLLSYCIKRWESQYITFPWYKKVTLMEMIIAFIKCYFRGDICTKSRES